ncbi:MAG: hypothetical protein DI553_00470 [Cutibacterium acnes]|nr:MAG: hypothetical protein DI553_00470 [Cutibacterium acnes]
MRLPFKWPDDDSPIVVRNLNVLCEIAVEGGENHRCERGENNTVLGRANRSNVLIEKSFFRIA